MASISRALIFLCSLQHSTQRTTMTRKAEGSCLHLNNQISRSQALAHLAWNEIDQCSAPAVDAPDPQLEAEDADQE
jgi:hypothetical protein